MLASGHCCLDLWATLGYFLQKLNGRREGQRASKTHGNMYVYKIPLERPSGKVLMDVAQPWVIFPPALKYCQTVGGQAKTDTPQWNADRPGWHQASDKGTCSVLINSLAAPGTCCSDLLQLCWSLEGSVAGSTLPWGWAAVPSVEAPVACGGAIGLIV